MFFHYLEIWVEVQEDISKLSYKIQPKFKLLRRKIGIKLRKLFLKYKSTSLSFKNEVFITFLKYFLDFVTNEIVQCKAISWTE